MKKCHFIHLGTKVSAKAKDGWKWKRRRKGQFQQSYVLASSTHKSTHKLADLQITVENYEGEELDYNTAYRKVDEVNKVDMKVTMKSFKLLIPFLQEWQERNPSSTVDWSVDSNNHIEHVFACPPYTEHVLKHFHLMISVDAAHLNSCYKGTIYIYMGLTENGEAIILLLA